MKARELTQLAEDFLVRTYPRSIVIREFSVSDGGAAMIDVAAVTEREIVGVEIKGEGDSPARLPLQGAVYPRVARRMWLLCTPEGTLRERCKKIKPRGWGVLEVRGEAAFPARVFRTSSKARTLKDQSPRHLCGTLWRDELVQICKDLDVDPGRSRPTVEILTDVLCDQVPVTRLHDAMIVALRRRQWRRPVTDTRK